MTSMARTEPEHEHESHNTQAFLAAAVCIYP